MATVTIEVVAQDTRGPVPGALVSLVAAKQNPVIGITDQQGKVMFRVPAGSYHIRASAARYDAFTSFTVISNEILLPILLMKVAPLSQASLNLRWDALQISNWDAHFMAAAGVNGIGKGKQKVVIILQPGTPIPSFIPATIEGVPVEVRFDEFRLLSTLPALKSREEILVDRRKRWRPIVGGISMGHQMVTAGTYSCSVVDNATRQRMIISNNHVIALQWGEQEIGRRGDPTLQPGPYDGGGIADKVGELERWIKVVLEGKGTNLIDAAIARITHPDGSRDDILEIGVPRPVIEPKVGMLVAKSGRTTGLTRGKIEEINATVNVGGAGVCTFVDQIITNYIATGGDSGSPVVNNLADRNILGLLFAGSDVRNVVCKGSHIERLLQVTFGAEPGPPPDFKIELNPNQIAIKQGESGRVEVSVVKV